MNRRGFIRAVGLGAVGLSILPAASSRAGGPGGKPNVIIILADDLGNADTSISKGWIKTPHLERMRTEGLTFTDFHSNSSVCSPTRAALISLLASLLISSFRTTAMFGMSHILEPSFHR